VGIVAGAARWTISVSLLSRSGGGQVIVHHSEPWLRVGSASAAGDVVT
jgi:hypothetical protein